MATLQDNQGLHNRGSDSAKSIAEVPNEVKRHARPKQASLCRNRGLYRQMVLTYQPDHKLQTSS